MNIGKIAGDFIKGYVFVLMVRSMKIKTGSAILD
jgi:hypothetical protein